MAILKALNKPEIKLAAIAGLLFVVLDLVLKSIIEPQVINPGTVLGLAPANGIITILHVMIITAGYGWLSGQLATESLMLNFGIMLALTVSLSNLFDRLALGGVRDYIEIAGIWFNIADAVVTSVIMLVLTQYIYAEILNFRTTRRQKA